MVQVLQQPSIVTVVPKDGQLEIKLDITINLTSDGMSFTTMAVEAKKKEDDETKYVVPDFSSGATLNFGNKIKREK